jgi:hypothetical protein
MISTKSLPETNNYELEKTIMQFKALRYELDSITRKRGKITIRGKKLLGYYKAI